ncbi:MAG TPA: hypothetical protein VFA16_03115 [Mycobacterium sp.]|uniref:hypothetical protein n=1 Tax=Mycobacterium sp. TaxID=1785 RepID=UPI002D7164A7|nr:hypothetical protein [Mycobacterium sp.]HZU46240.1 hypothetical protein [Mycobacterium sp.]
MPGETGRWSHQSWAETGEPVGEIVDRLVLPHGWAASARVWGAVGRTWRAITG